MASDCNGNCPSCRASSVNNDLTDEAMQWLTRQFAMLNRTFARRRQAMLRITSHRRHPYDAWEYPYE